jgi:hypothetical protein
MPLHVAFTSAFRILPGRAVGHACRPGHAGGNSSQRIAAVWVRSFVLSAYAASLQGGAYWAATAVRDTSHRSSCRRSSRSSWCQWWCGERIIAMRMVALRPSRSIVAPDVNIRLRPAVLAASRRASAHMTCSSVAPSHRYFCYAAAESAVVTVWVSPSMCTALTDRLAELLRAVAKAASATSAPGT